MGSNDPERLELVRVGRRDGRRPPALVVAAAVCLVLAMAVWKPWASGPAPSARPSELPGAPAGGLPSGLASEPGVTDPPDSTPRPSRVTFAGLDLGLMGTADPHTAWGVAVAYVSQRQFDVAKERGAATVTPVVSWELIEPGESEPGSTLDHPGATSIGIAATWPRGTLPGAIRLFHAGEEIPLGGSLWNLLRDVPLQASELPIRSGDFYLPWSARPTQPADWIGNGWPVGAYAFEVEIGPGVRKMLPFTLGGARSP